MKLIFQISNFKNPYLKTSNLFNNNNEIKEPIHSTLRKRTLYRVHLYMKITYYIYIRIRNTYVTNARKLARKFPILQFATVARLQLVTRLEQRCDGRHEQCCQQCCSAIITMLLQHRSIINAVIIC